MRINILAFSGLIVSFFSQPVWAACAPDSLGTHRTIELSHDDHKLLLGHEKKLGLKSGEVILTFDDGPIAGKTTRVLKALRKECVKATFFTVGTMARAYPKLLNRIVNDGHSLAHHTHAHNRLTEYSVAEAERLIDRGIATVEKIAYGDVADTPRVPFFRYPYLSRNKATDRMLRKKGLIAIDANIDSRDWKTVSADTVHDKIMRLLRREKKGIILMHDIQNRTAKMLPRLLRSLKDNGYKIVHIVPRGYRPERKRENEMVVASLGGVPEFPAVAENSPVKRHLEDQAKRQFSAALNSIPGRERILARSSISDPIVEQAQNIGNRVKVITDQPQITHSVPPKSIVKRSLVSRLEGRKRIKSKHKLVRKTKAQKIAMIARRWKLRPSQWIIK